MIKVDNRILVRIESLLNRKHFHTEIFMLNNQAHSFHTGKLLSMFFVVFFSLQHAASVSGANRNPVADFDGDGKSDVSVFRPSDGYWYISKSSGGYSFVHWGLSTDNPVPGDYDGDGKTDLAIHRKYPNNTWYILRSSDNTFRVRTWGATDDQQSLIYRDKPMPADYDGDGKTDLAVYRLTDYFIEPGRFVILQSSTDSGISAEWGSFGDRVIPADYDGDGKIDYAISRTGNGLIFGNPGNNNVTWFIFQSSDSKIRIEYFGLGGDKPVPADYDGDGQADIAVWRPSNGYWYWISSRDKSFNTIQFGLSDDKPVPGDYDGDGRTDFSVFRPSNGVWYLEQSSRGFRAEQFGLSGDVPIPNVFIQ